MTLTVGIKFTSWSSFTDDFMRAVEEDKNWALKSLKMVLYKNNKSKIIMDKNFDC